MVYTGFLDLGGREVINADRTAQYVRLFLPNLDLSGCGSCEGLYEALGYPPYTSPLVDRPSWFDADNTDTWDFYGLLPLTFEGFEDSTVDVKITEFVGDGGAVSMPRRGSRSVRITGLLIGQDEAAVSAGMVWLRSVLQAGRCAVNPNVCTGDHLTYFIACPPLCEDSPALAAQGPVRECATGTILSPIAQCAMAYERHLYNTVCVDGPRITNVFAPTCGAMSQVEFTLVAGVASPFGTGQQVVSLTPDVAALPVVPDYVCDPGTSGQLVQRTNIAPNPGPTLANEGWNSLDPAFWTNGSAAAAQSVRTNWAADPRATTLDHALTLSPRTSRGFGIGGAGTYQVVTGSIEGPIGAVSTYVRKRFTTAPVDLDDAAGTGVDFGSLTPNGGALAVTPGEIWTFSVWARSSVRARLAMDVHVGDATGELIPAGWFEPYGNPGGDNNAPGVVAASRTSANTWVHLSLRITIPPDITYINVIADRTASDADAAAPWVDNATFDATALLAERVSGVGDWFAGDSANTATITHAWTGAPNASPSTETTVMGEVTDPGSDLPVSGLAVVSRRTVAGGWAPAMIGAAQHVGAYGSAVAMQPIITAGITSSASVWMFASVAGYGQLEVQPINEAGQGVGPVFSTSSDIVPASTWVRPAIIFTPPAGSVAVQITARMFVGAGSAPAGAVAWFTQCLVEGIPGPARYFDGNSSSSDPSVTFDWIGLPGHSPSRMVQTLTPGQIVDPDCPPIPPPPRPPIVEDTCITTSEEYHRFTVTIPADIVPAWSDVVPILNLTTREAPVRQLRMRFYSNPLGLPVYALVQCAFMGEFIVSYIPPYSTMTIDGISRQVLITGQTGLSQPGSHLLYGSGGGPVSWPAMQCGGQYDMAVDLEHDGGTVTFELCVAGRE